MDPNLGVCVGHTVGVLVKVKPPGLSVVGSNPDLVMSVMCVCVCVTASRHYSRSTGALHAPDAFGAAGEL